jgi:hypothetical protein
VAGDDPAYFLVGIVTAGTSLLRDLALVVFAVVVGHRLRAMRPQRDPRRDGEPAPEVLSRLRNCDGTGTATMVGVLVVGAFEVVRICVTWSAAHPTTATCGLSVATCVINALAVTYVAFRPKSRAP